jgi:hypothetical protein
MNSFSELFEFSDERNKWLSSPDGELFSSCVFEAFKSTGHGGQKKNKTSSAVRLVHTPSGIAVTASGSRSQAQNRRSALKKLRFEIATRYRGAGIPGFSNKEMGIRNSAYHIWVAVAVDCLFHNGFKVKSAASEFGLSTSKFIKMLYRDSLLWQKVNTAREAAGMKKLNHG